MRAKFLVPSMLALAAATPASAQSVISRSITTEPVETIVTQTPTGTIVTRRPLGAGVAAPAPVVRRVETTQPTMRELVTREVAHRPPAAATHRAALPATKVGKVTADSKYVSGICASMIGARRVRKGSPANSGVPSATAKRSPLREVSKS